MRRRGPAPSVTLCDAERTTITRRVTIWTRQAGFQAHLTARSARLSGCAQTPRQSSGGPQGSGGRSFCGSGVHAGLLALLGADRRRSRGQRVEAAPALRERDHLADRVAAGQQRADPVPAEGDAAVRRGAVLEGVEQEAELLLRLVLARCPSPRRPASGCPRGGYGSTRRRSRCRCRRCRRPRPARCRGRCRRSSRSLGEVNAWCTAVQAPQPTATSPAAVASAAGSNSGASTTQRKLQASSSIRPPRRPISRRAAPSSARLRLHRTGGEEDAVARLGADVRGDARPAPRR